MKQFPYIYFFHILYSTSIGGCTFLHTQIDSIETFTRPITLNTSGPFL